MANRNMHCRDGERQRAGRVCASCVLNVYSARHSLSFDAYVDFYAELEWIGTIRMKLSICTIHVRDVHALKRL